MPLLLKDNKPVQDSWTAVEAIEDLPEAGPAIVPLDLWREHREALLNRNAPVGVRLKSDQPPGEIADDLEHISLIALEFPKFTDGRAYSYARLLRERHGYQGELRAVGNVLRDQAIFMVRCGFDAFEVDEKTAQGWQGALARLSQAYQPAADGVTPAPWLRHRRRQAAE